MSDIRIPINLSDTSEKVVNIKLDHEFENLDVLSLKITNSDAYRRMCSDFGVIVGRVALSSGYGVENAKVTIFVPITDVDQSRPEITSLYPFTSVTDTFPNGVRYNLLPRVRGNNPSHRAVGNFPDISDFSQYPQMVEVYEKYYKFTTRTNYAGDYMIFGVPLGTHDVVMDFDLFDTTSFDLTANDLVQQSTVNNTLDSLNKAITSLGTTSPTIDPNQIPDYVYYGNNNFEVKVKLDISSMPNIFSQVKNINVSPFWGDNNFCDVGITRCDFTLSYKYTPTAVFFGYLDSVSDGFAINKDYNYQIGIQPEILAVDSSLGYYTGDLYPYKNPKVVVYKLASDGISRERVGVYDTQSDNGIFRLSLPMYSDYYFTNEFGDLVPTTDTNLGIPTKGCYSFEFYDSSEIWYNRRNPQGWYGNNILPGFRVPASPFGDGNLGGWEDIRTSTFEYDIINKKRKFYTIKTTYSTTDKTNVITSGGYVSWFPQQNPNKISSDIYWNYPVDYRDVPNIEDMSIIGSILMPRLAFYPQSTYDITSSNFDVYGPVNIMSVPSANTNRTYIDSIGSIQTYADNIKTYEKILGIGVTPNGLNGGSVFDSLYGGSDFININGQNIYDLQDTWNYGDNANGKINLTPFAIDLKSAPGSTANEFGVQSPYTQALDKQYTYGAFISSTTYQNLSDMLEVSIYDITDELDGLIADKVYSSFMKGDVNEFNTSPGTTNHYKANMYNNNFYYFGRFDPNNALIDIQNYYKYKQNT